MRCRDADNPELAPAQHTVIQVSCRSCVGAVSLISRPMVEMTILCWYSPGGYEFASLSVRTPAIKTLLPMGGGKDRRGKMRQSLFIHPSGHVRYVLRHNGHSPLFAFDWLTPAAPGSLVLQYKVLV